MSNPSPDVCDSAVTSSVKRVALLVEASALLASLDHRASLTKLARLVVPTIADWWAVDLLEEAGALHRVISQGLPHHPRCTT
jgi:hypothetical protein